VGGKVAKILDSVKIGCQVVVKRPMNETPNSGTTDAVYHHGDLPNALLEAVAALVDEKGSAGVSLREVARRAGVSHSAPAHHFGDKEGMLAAFSARGYRILASEMRDAREHGSDVNAMDRMGAVGAAYVTFALNHKPYFEVMFRSGIDKERYEELGAEARGAFTVFMEAVADLTSDESLSGLDQRIVGMYFWSLAHGLASLVSEGSLPPELEELSSSDYILGIFSMSSATLDAGASD